MKRKPPSTPEEVLEACNEIVRRALDAHGALHLQSEALRKSLGANLRRRPPPPKGRKGGGSEPVSVEPNRPKLGEGGAAAALEFDE
jgi:hypothetical protein